MVFLCYRLITITAAASDKNGVQSSSNRNRQSSSAKPLSKPTVPGLSMCSDHRRHKCIPSCLLERKAQERSHLSRHRPQKDARRTTRRAPLHCASNSFRTPAIPSTQWGYGRTSKQARPRRNSQCKACRPSIQPRLQRITNQILSVTQCVNRCGGIPRRTRKRRHITKCVPERAACRQLLPWHNLQPVRAPSRSPGPSSQRDSSRQKNTRPRNNKSSAWHINLHFRI